MIQRLIILSLVLSTTTRADEFFNSKIEPLLREHCFECHSHEHTIEAGLALDSKSGWEQGGDSGSAISPGNPDESLLIRKVRWSDSDHQMPPSDRLSEEKVALLEQWVRRGAPDPRQLIAGDSDSMDWWSLRPLKLPAVPDGVHPIDGFVRDKLKQVGRSPSPRADRKTLIRRLYITLHGLLPSPEEVHDFVEETHPQAWTRLIEQLLASPHYGERWARHWLDTVHFADSHGCEHDVKRPNAWRYRDYVIARLNDDVPWDRFIREQLAADELYPEQPQLKAALGFIAAGPLELSRAGTAPVTFDYLDRDDIVAQTMAAFTSTTANCARCHTHKFDPITQEDYYSLQAVFAGVGKGDIEFDVSAAIMRRRRQWNAVLSATSTLDDMILLDEQHAEVIDQWINKRRSQSTLWTILQPDIFLASGGATLTKQDDGSIFAQGTVADQERYTVGATVELDRLTAVRLEVLRDDRLPHGGPGRAGNGNLHLAEVDFHWFPRAADEGVKLTVARASADFDQDGWTAQHAIDGDLKSGWAIYPKVNESHKIVFELQDPIDTSKGGKLAITLKQLYPPKHLIGRFRVSVTDAAEGAARLLPNEVIEGLNKPADQRSIRQQTAVAAAALKPYAEQRLRELPPKAVVYGVSAFWSHAKKLPEPQQPKVVHLLRRGRIDQPLRQVAPGTLAIIPGIPSRFDLEGANRESTRRAALANWIAHRDNPLTWRSIVNRVWSYHFGRGLCDTPNDFGRMGSPPTHPELLDWLAIWFRDEANGSLKQLHRLILTSETWQQSSLISKANPVSGLPDAENRLLWRMNRQRLDADAFRDCVLSLSGKLNRSFGGPGIEEFGKTKGPQATPVLDYNAYDWNAHQSHRRSIYRVVWRGIPDPLMEVMDFPDLALLSPRRGTSVSSLQSLSLYNSDFVLQNALWMADRVERNVSADARVSRAAELCWQREPTAYEQIKLEAYADHHGIPALCRVLINSNEFLFID